MDKKEFMEQLEALKTDLSNALTEKAKAEIGVQIKALEEKFKAVAGIEGDIKLVKEDIKVVKDATDKTNEWINEQKKKAGRSPFGVNDIDSNSFKSNLITGLKAKENDLKNYRSNRSQIIVDLKAVGDIGSGNFTSSGTQTFTGPTMIPGIQRAAYEETHMRDILPVSSITTDSVAVIRGNRGEGGPTTVAVGGLKPQSDADWTKVIVPVTKIAHYYTIPEEWLEDVSWLADDITQTGLAELKLVEDTKIISNNTSGEFTGLVQNSTAYASPTGLALGVDNANNYDVLVAAMTQLKNAKRGNANFILVDNDSWAKMVLSKGTDGHYLFGAPNVGIPNVFGVPIYAMTASTLADKFIIGDKNMAVIAVRSGVSVRFYDQHANNAIYNLVTVVIEERFALVVKRVDAFVYGDFSDARTALETV